MNNQKDTRSNSTPTYSGGIPARTRKISEITSPEGENTNNDDKKRHKNNKNHKNKNNLNMGDKGNEILESIRELKGTLKTMDSKLSLIKGDVTQLKDDMQQVKEDVRYANNKILHVENYQQQQQQQIQHLNKTVNMLEQNNLNCQLSIHNIPNHLSAQQCQEALAKWSNGVFDPAKVLRFTLPLTRKKDSKIAFIHFASTADKIIFMKFITAKHKDSSGAHVPILNEQLFQLKEDDTKRGIELNFRTPMTSLNQEIFMWLRKEGRRIHPDIKVWISSKGTVHSRLSQAAQAKPIFSIEQAKDFVDAH